MDTVKPIDPAHVDVATRLESEGVDYVIGGWIDVQGRSKSKVAKYQSTTRGSTFCWILTPRRKILNSA